MMSKLKHKFNRKNGFDTSDDYKVISNNVTGIIAEKDNDYFASNTENKLDDDNDDEDIDITDLSKTY